MAEIIVKTFIVKGSYKTRHGVNKNVFEKEVRATTPEDAVKVVKQSIACQKVSLSRISIDKVEEITNPENIKNRVIKTFSTENIKV